jgi:hypothetical protein
MDDVLIELAAHMHGSRKLRSGGATFRKKFRSAHGQSRVSGARWEELSSRTRGRGY